jgi:two-component system cell cycle sensor histidine kinase/response regulator CckA
MDGMTLIRTMRRIRPETKVIVSTGREETCRSPEMEALAVDACLMKPYTREKLLLTLAEVFQRDRAVAA